MKSKPFILVVFGLMVAFQWYVPMDMILGIEKVLNKGTVYKFKTRPIDPVDPFRGRFVTLGFEEGTIELSEDANLESFYFGQTAYATLENDSSGYARLVGLYLEEPANELDYLKVEIESTSRVPANNIRVELPFERFYMQEFKAIEAERLFNATVTSDSVIIAFAEVRVLHGESALEDVKVNGRSLKELAEEHLLETDLSTTESLEFKEQ